MYECVLENEIATLVSASLLYVDSKFELEPRACGSLPSSLSFPARADPLTSTFWRSGLVAGRSMCVRRGEAIIACKCVVECVRRTLTRFDFPRELQVRLHTRRPTSL